MTTEQVVPVVMDVALPAGMAGPDPVEFDVRCFLVRHDDGLVLVDAGFPADGTPIALALAGMGAGWSDLSDVVLTHAHPDHCGALAALPQLAPSAAVWGGAGDEYPPFVRAVEGGETVRGLRVVATPGHTAGHLCLFDEDRSTLFSGDAVGSQAGLLTQGPRPFIADPEEAMRSLRLLSALGAHRMLFGHGGEVPDPAGALMAFIASEGLQT
ncbi:MAG: MBL fold metallo-hydrolase [Lapillicoccus sp.]